MFLIIWDGDSDPSDLAVRNQLGNYSKVNPMKKFLMNIWHDEAGAETAEWIVIVALILAVAMVVYTGVLQTSLVGVVSTISDAIGLITIGPGAG
jgi:Flp pilus assembly pilin Flp